MTDFGYNMTDFVWWGLLHLCGADLDKIFDKCFLKMVYQINESDSVKQLQIVHMMTRLKNLIFLFLVFALRLDAQLVEDNKPKNLTESLDIQSITFCKEKDYQFKIEDRFYFEDGKIYVCPRNLPLNVTVVDAIAPNSPIPLVTTWSINGAPNPSVNHTVTLNAANFNGDEAILICTFMDALGVQKTLEIKVKKNVKLEWNDGGGIFAFDENEEVNYPGFENPITPWVFIGTNGEKMLRANVKPDKGFYAVHDITPQSPDLVINPNDISTDNEIIKFNHITVVYDEQIDVFGCSDTHPELKVFTQTPKVFTIEVFRLCESDDDVQVIEPGPTKYTPNTIIISPGIDGTLDRWKKFLKWRTGDDELWMDPATLLTYVVAGDNMMAETKILKNNQECPEELDIMPFMNSLNSTYGQVSVSAINIITTDLLANYDIEWDNDSLSKFEQRVFHDLRKNANKLLDGFTEVYIVKDLGVQIDKFDNVTNILGRASWIKKNTLALDRHDADPSVLAHEVGHAKFGLIHPEDEFGVPIPKSKYINNFMHESDDKTDKILKYQFHLINN